MKCSAAVSIQSLTSLSLTSWSYLKTFNLRRLMKSHSAIVKKRLKKLNPGFALLHFHGPHSLLASYIHLRSPQNSHYSHNAACRWDWARAEEVEWTEPENEGESVLFSTVEPFTPPSSLAPTCNKTVFKDDLAEVKWKMSVNESRLTLSPSRRTLTTSTTYLFSAGQRGASGGGRSTQLSQNPSPRPLCGNKRHFRCQDWMWSLSEPVNLFPPCHCLLSGLLYWHRIFPRGLVL